VATDVTDASQVSAMVARTVERCGRLDYAVNNAGVINERGRRTSCPSKSGTG
jgi:NAD(P)-dependent dehydrogenase (short-subunit alcohol dehydrogenase family)